MKQVYVNPFLFSCHPGVAKGTGASPGNGISPGHGPQVHHRGYHRRHWRKQPAAGQRFLRVPRGNGPGRR